MLSLSIIVPIYHGKEYIPFIFQMIVENYKVAKKTFSLAVELIFVNDSPEIPIDISDLKHDNIAVICIRNPCNEGIHKSRLNGFHVASGSYILFLDQDDVISARYFLMQLQCISDNDISICNGVNYGKYIINSFSELKNKIYHKDFIEFGKQIFLGQILIKNTAIPLEWKKNIILNNCADDLYLLALMLFHNKKIYLLEKRLYCHVITGHNQSFNTDDVESSNNEVYEYLYRDGVISEAQLSALKRLSPSELPYNELLESNRKHVAYILLLDSWFKNFRHGIGIDDYFKRRNMTRIAIYGVGILAQHLIHELEGSSVFVDCFFDKKIEAFHGIRRLTVGMPISEVDAIVVTPIFSYKAIYSELNRFYSCRIISLDEIVTSLSLLD